MTVSQHAPTKKRTYLSKLKSICSFVVGAVVGTLISQLFSPFIAPVVDAVHSVKGVPVRTVVINEVAYLEGTFRILQRVLNSCREEKSSSECPTIKFQPNALSKLQIVGETSAMTFSGETVLGTLYAIGSHYGKCISIIENNHNIYVMYSSESKVKISIDNEARCFI